MKTKFLTEAIGVFIVLCILTSCNNKNDKHIDSFDLKKNETAARATLRKLLNSIENRDLESLNTTMSPTGKMELIIPNRPITYTVDEFVELHQNWFKDTVWTIETKILHIKAGQDIAFATTDAMYKEPERDGKPYFNHIIVSYVLEKINNTWYVVKDHACSLKKSTD